MSEERSLIANLVPKVEDSDLDAFVKQIQDSIESAMTVTVNVPESSSSSSSSSSSGGDTGGTAQQAQETAQKVQEAVQTMSETMEDMGDITESMDEAFDAINDAMGDTGEAVDSMNETVGGALSEVGELFEQTDDAVDDIADTVSDSSKDEKDAKGNILGPILDIAKEGVGAINFIWDLAEKGWKKLESASPLLKTTMDLFKNAVNLILMPIGTAFAVELIPLLKELYDFIGNLTETMWNAYEEGGISSMIAIGITEGIPALIEAMISAMELIPDDVPFLSAMRDFSIFLLSWLESNADALVNTFEVILSIAKLILDNIKLVISVISGFAVAYFLAKAADVSFFGTKWGGAQTAIGLSALAVGAGVYAGMTVAGYAEGGYVSSPTFATVAESEPEYIIPESKVGSFINANSGGNGNVTVNFYGYNDDEFVRRVEEVVNRNTTLSALRSGF